MKKIFMALMAVAAIAMTSCGPDNDPKDPNEGNHPSGGVKTAAVTFIPAITADWLKLADVYVYDSLDNQAPKAETLTDLYIERTSTILDSQHKVTVRTSEFANAQHFAGCIIKTNLTTEQTYGVRVEVKLKENYLDIIKAMDAQDTLYLYSVVAYGMQSADPEYYAESINEGKTRPSRILEAIEKNPDYLSKMAELEGRTASCSFTTNGETISAK